MARQGRRLTIGGAGPIGSNEDQFSQTGARGEVRRYIPTSETDAAREAARIGAGQNSNGESEIGPDGNPIIIMPPVQQGGSGGPSPSSTDPGAGQASGTGAPGAGGQSDSGDPGSPGDYARGGKVGGKGTEHAITAQAGEWVINKDAVKKYGDKFMALLNAGKVPVMTREQWAKSRR